MISTNNMPTDFANYLWNKYRKSYILLQNDFNINEVDNNIILELQNQTFFKDFCDEAEKNLERIKTCWEKHKDEINLFLEQMFKKAFTLETTAIIVAPALCCGMNIGNNQFIWGHKDGLTDENYDLVYIVHESLHSYFKSDDLTHAIIENISDIELAMFLNNSEYGYHCHDRLKNMHIKLLPFWNIYLNKTKKGIEKSKSSYGADYDQNDFISYQSKIREMNIDDFINFLYEKKLDEIVDVKTVYSITPKNKSTKIQNTSSL